MGTKVGWLGVAGGLDQDWRRPDAKSLKSQVPAQARYVGLGHRCCANSTVRYAEAPLGDLGSETCTRKDVHAQHGYPCQEMLKGKVVGGQSVPHRGFPTIPKRETITTNAHPRRRTIAQVSGSG